MSGNWDEPQGNQSVKLMRHLTPKEQEEITHFMKEQMTTNQTPTPEFNCPPPCKHGYISYCIACEIERLERELAAEKKRADEYRSYLYGCASHGLWKGMACIGCLEQERDQLKADKAAMLQQLIDGGVTGDCGPCETCDTLRAEVATLRRFKALIDEQVPKHAQQSEDELNNLHAEVERLNDERVKDFNTDYKVMARQQKDEAEKLRTRLDSLVKISEANEIAMKLFVDKVESGKARSVKTYSDAKEFLAAFAKWKKENKL